MDTLTTGARGTMISLSGMAEAVEENWSRNELFRLCIVEYPRRFHTASINDRQRLVERGPRLTNSVWDAAIGASIEQACLAHGCYPPTWTDEPERFLAGPEELLPQWSATVSCHLPAPFTRRGIVIDARNLDRRTGDERWRPDIGDPDDRWPRRPEQGEDNRAREPEHEAEGRLDKCCESIESEALRSGWALRVCLGQGRRARTFALGGTQHCRQPDRVARRRANPGADPRGLAGTGVNEQEWHELVNQASNPGAKSRIPPRTVWNRPALTVAGTAPGIVKQWESAWVAKR